MTTVPSAPDPVDERLLAEAAQVKGVSLGQDAWRRLKKKRVAMASLGFLILLALLAFFTPLLPLQAPQLVNTKRQFQPPSLAPQPLFPDRPGEQDDRSLQDQRASRIKEGFGDLNFLNQAMLDVRLWLFGDWAVPSICGTDKVGRDMLSRIFWGARVSLIVGVVATLVSLVIGVSYGAVSGYLGGRVDNLMMRLVDVMYSIPFIFVVIFLITVLSEESIKTRLQDYYIDRITIFYFVVGAIYWLTMARVVRGQVISLKNEQFVEAARTVGAGQPRIIFRHLVPNLMSVIIVYLTLTIPRVMLFEAFLSFLGLGVQEPDVSWGLLAKEGVQVITPIQILWWLVVFPGLALGMTLFSLNFLGDGLRDALDPRLKNR